MSFKLYQTFVSRYKAYSDILLTLVEIIKVLDETQDNNLNSEHETFLLMVVPGSSQLRPHETCAALGRVILAPGRQ